MYNSNFDFSYDEILSQVLQFMRELGIYPHDTRLILDGRIHRYVVEGDKLTHQNGAYCIYTDGVPAGWVQNWKVSAEAINWKFDLREYSNEQRNYFNSDEYRKLAEKKRLDREKKQKEEEVKASQNALAVFQSLERDPQGHPYLIKKNIFPYNLRLDKKDNSLVVPLSDINGNIVTLQKIYPNGDKRFFKGASTTGVFWSIALDTLTNTIRDKILLGEGVATMAKIYELTHYPCVAAMNCGNLMNVAQALKNKYPKSKIVVMADDDKETELKNGFNPGRTAAERVVKNNLAKTFLLPPFKSPADGTDWDDFAIKYGNDMTEKYLKKIIIWACLTEKQKKEFKNIEQITAQELIKKKFMPIKWVVKDFIPSGLSVLAGSPKIGKSRLALHLALGVATGGCVLGKINVEQGDVLYLALEDTQRRLQERIKNSGLSENCDLERLTLTTRVPRQHEGGLEYIRWWLEEHKDARFVIIDTLQKFRKQLSNASNVYSEDYDVLSEIKALADEFDVAVFIIHHLKKAMQEDWVNELSGSQGITGAADTLLALKRKRSDCQGILHRTGRDVEEADFNMELDEETGWWILNGEVEPEKPKLSVTQKKITDYLIEDGGVKTPQAIAQNLGIGISTVKGTLRRLLDKGVVEQNSYGSYSACKGSLDDVRPTNPANLDFFNEMKKEYPEIK
ncbi:MAG: AAA family ATPase [Synergistaceae bacterium]|nr:AAA family ATPase [Synergistaceae bacterium]